MGFHCCSCFFKTLSYLGLLIIYALSSVGQWMALLILRVFGPSCSVPISKRYGPWAVVTGGSDGIGEAIAKELFKEGLNVLLIARNEQRLQEAKERILKSVMPQNNQQIKIFVFDFSFDAWNQENHLRLKNELQSLDVGFLINNVGMGYPSAQKYDELDKEFIDNLISVNLRSTMLVTHMLLPGMRSRRRGAILCIGSGASALPSEPLYAGYAAVKAGVSGFCNSLRVEVAQDNIVVQCQTPLLITTKLSKIKRPSMTVLSCEKYAVDALNCMKKDVLFPYWTTATRCPSLVHELILVAASVVIPLGVWNKYGMLGYSWLFIPLLRMYYRIRLSQTSNIRRRYMNKQR